MREQIMNLTVSELEGKSLSELYDIAKELELPGFTRLKKHELVGKIVQSQSSQNGQSMTEGVLEILSEGYGFLRPGNYQPGPDDIYVSQSQIRRFYLRTGDQVLGQVRPPKDNEKYWGLLRVERVNGLAPEEIRRRPYYEALTPIFPNRMFKLETESQILSTRLLDLLAPIGAGQRGLIVAPPKAGKTLFLKNIANGISTNYGDKVQIMVCLVGERPEEVTDMERSVRGEVKSSTFDEPPENQVRVAELLIERAKRLVELGQDVVVLLDSLTRLTRAYNLAIPSSGRTLSGGIDPGALIPPRRFFGAARNIEEGGSLTIIATALVETGSKMDEVIFEEFKGTGNMEVHLDRKLSERRVFPAVDVGRSGTRRDDLLLSPETLRQAITTRRMLEAVGAEGVELLLTRLGKSKSNEDFLASLSRAKIDD